MLKKISNLGEALSKAQQKQVNGGREPDGGCRRYEWHPVKRCCWSDHYNCCDGTPECPAPLL
ncbi:hypothetical protein [Aquimarina sp. Aq78]|uniref:hypothetical protein n=1 Tax=Aquimarina sp. Aq78 TaxID=1191889 RepID=UPI000D5537FB|nr:hypothetical protein [Aquimarina sp. Aq78]